MSNPINIVFFGTPEFSVQTLETVVSLQGVKVTAVVTQPDRPAGRGGALSASPVKQAALRHNIPVLQPERIKKDTSGFISELSKYGPFDLGIVVAFGQILPQAVLDLPKMGCVNIHGSLLPRWRGAAPIQRAILSGDKQTGICLMAMDAGLDTGAVYAQASTDISESDTFQTLHDKLSVLGANLLANKLRDIVAGSLSATPQPADGVTYAQKISNEEAAIVWSESAAAIDRKIRSLSPVPGAFSQLAGKRLKIYNGSAHNLEIGDDSLSPGTIIRVTKDSFEIKCGQGSYSPTLLQLEGKKRMSVEDFLRGVMISANTRLG